MASGTQKSSAREILERLDVNPTLEESDASRLAVGLDLREALRRQSAADSGEHLELSELKRLAEARRQAAEWQMPDHLTVCPVCLDLFQALLEKVPSLSPATTRRFVRAWDRPLRRLEFNWARLILKMAAAILILVGGIYLFYSQTNRSPLLITRGEIADASGHPMVIHKIVPSNRKVVAREPLQVALNDGTTVEADAGTAFSFTRSLRGRPVFSVEQGEILVKAAKQEDGSSLAVRTPLGTIRVVGTVFRVAVGSEDAVVHETRAGSSDPVSYPARISSVIVTVQEGVVSVANPHEQVRVTAGQTAVLRQGQARIEIR